MPATWAKKSNILSREKRDKIFYLRIFHFVSDHEVSPTTTIKLVWSSNGFSYYLDKSNQELNKVRRNQCVSLRYYDSVLLIEIH